MMSIWPPLPDIERAKKVLKCGAQRLQWALKLYKDDSFVLLYPKPDLILILHLFSIHM